MAGLLAQYERCRRRRSRYLVSALLFDHLGFVIVRVIPRSIEDDDNIIFTYTIMSSYSLFKSTNIHNWINSDLEYFFCVFVINVQYIYHIEFLSIRAWRRLNVNTLCWILSHLCLIVQIPIFGTHWLSLAHVLAATVISFLKMNHRRRYSSLF